MVTTLLREGARGAGRWFFRQPALAASAVLTLGLGVGLAVALFSILRGTLLRPLPFDGGERLMALGRVEEAGGRLGELTRGEYQELARRLPGLEATAAYSQYFFFVTADGTGTYTEAGAEVSAGFFELLGVRPLLGRTLVPADETPGQPRVGLISEGLWHTLFGADPTALGETLIVNREPVTIVGVMPAGFAFPHSQQVWIVLPAGADTAGQSVSVVARRAPGTSLGQVRAELAVVARQMAAIDSDPGATNASREPGVAELRLHGEPFLVAAGDRRLREALPAMFGAIAGIFLIASFNVSALLILRARQRRREEAVRVALGAGRGALLAPTLGEGLALTVTGGLLGGLIAGWSVTLFERLMAPGDVLGGFWVDVHLDSAALAFACFAAVLGALLAGLAPAVGSLRVSPAPLLRDGGWDLSGIAAGRLRRLFVAAQVALTCALLITSGLLARTVRELGSVDWGFEPSGLVGAKISLFQRTDLAPGGEERFLTALAERLRALPGVEQVAFTTALPTQGSFPGEVELADSPGEGRPARWQVVTPELFSTLRIPRVAGRWFDSSDRPEAPPVAVLSRGLARTWWPEGEAVGQRFRMLRGARAGEWITVVGVVGDVAGPLGGAAATAPGREAPLLYLALPQAPRASMVVVLRTSLELASVAPLLRREVVAVDPLAACFDIEAVEALLARQRWPQRALGGLFGALGLVGLVLAVSGLYGVSRVAVAERGGELGVRAALGATGRDLARLVLGEGLKVVVLGLAMGLILTTLLARAVASLLLTLSPWDPITWLAGCLALTVATLLALVGPAWRAAMAEPRGQIPF